MSIGSRIKQTRKARGFTQDRLAEAADISRSYLADIEADRYNPSLSTLDKIASALTVHVSTLLGNNRISEPLDKLERLLEGLENSPSVDDREKAVEMREKILQILNSSGLKGKFIPIAAGSGKSESSLAYMRPSLSNEPNEERLREHETAYNEVVSLPIVGTVPAGTPILAEENIEGVMPLPSMFIKGKNDFLLKVRGDSMEDVNISDGDLVLVHQQPTAENGQTVIARINGAVTCKRFYRLNGKCKLEPANANYKPIDCTEVEIIGIVTRVIKEVF